jgi:glycosyltransferase involved in cell wall biosynthesis
VGFVAAQINEPRKGLNLLVDACAALRKDGIEVQLLSAGHGRQHGDRPWWNHFGPIGSIMSQFLALYERCVAY